MGFFTNAFMGAQRTAVKNKIAKMQYEYDGTWADAYLSSVDIEETAVVARASIEPTAEVGEITGIRLLDSEDTVIGSEEIIIPTSMTRSKLIVFRCPIQEV